MAKVRYRPIADIWLRYSFRLSSPLEIPIQRNDYRKAARNDEHSFSRQPRANKRQSVDQTQVTRCKQYENHDVKGRYSFARPWRRASGQVPCEIIAS